MKMQNTVVRQPLLNLDGFRLNHGTTFRLGYLGSDLILELLSGRNVIMAFLFQHFPMQKLNEKQKLLAIRHCPARDYPLDEAEINQLVPVQELPRLPSHPYWKIHSSFGEDLFWCDPDIWLELTPYGTGSSVSLYGYNLGQIGIIRYPGVDSDSDYVLTNAKELRSRMHIDRQIRVESLYEGQRVTWYTPPKRRTNE